MCGPECSLLDPCQESEPCMNGAICLETCSTFPDYKCQCAQGYAGKNCSEPVSCFFKQCLPSLTFRLISGTSSIRYVCKWHRHHCRSYRRSLVNNLWSCSGHVLSYGEKQESYSRHVQSISSRVLQSKARDGQCVETTTRRTTYLKTLVDIKVTVKVWTIRVNELWWNEMS